jgi:hypothetical protein
LLLVACIISDTAVAFRGMDWGMGFSQPSCDAFHHFHEHWNCFCCGTAFVKWISELILPVRSGTAP